MDRTVIDRLCAVRGRGACTDAERRAAGALHGVLHARRHEPYVEARWLRPQRRASLAVHAALAVAAALASATAPIPAAAVAAFAALSLAVEATGRTAPLARLGPRRATQHVLTVPQARPVTLLVAAGYDAPRRIPPALRRLHPFAGPPERAAAWLAVTAAVVAATAGVRTLSVDGAWPGLVALAATVVLLAGIGVAVDLMGAPWTSGAGRAAAAAVAVAVYDELERDPPRALAPALLLLGAREAGPQGLRAHLRAEGARPRDTVVLEIGPLGTGPPAWSARHPQLRAAAERAAAALGLPPAQTAPPCPGGTRGVPAIAIATPGADAEQAPDDATLDAVLDLALGVVDALDADVARAHAAQPA